MPYRATQDERVMVESSEKTWFTGEGNGKSLQYSSLENPMNSMKRKKYMTLKDKFSRSVGAQNASGEEAPERMKRWSQNENIAQLWL